MILISKHHQVGTTVRNVQDGSSLASGWRSCLTSLRMDQWDVLSSVDQLGLDVGKLVKTAKHRPFGHLGKSRVGLNSSVDDKFNYLDPIHLDLSGLCSKASVDTSLWRHQMEQWKSEAPFR